MAKKSPAKKPRATPATASRAPLDRLDALASSDPRILLGLVLWVNRFHNPTLSHQLTEKDLDSLNASTDYTKQVPVVKIERPLGRPAQPAVDPKPPSKAYPEGIPGRSAQAAEPPRPFVVVQLVDEKGNAIVPVENNQGDYDRGRAAAQLARDRENCLSIASAVEGDLRGGNFSDSTILELCRVAKVVALAR